MGMLFTETQILYSFNVYANISLIKLLSLL